MEYAPASEAQVLLTGLLLMFTAATLANALNRVELLQLNWLHVSAFLKFTTRDE
jgi:hypothetical protein